MSRERCMELFRDADAVVNLCGATEPSRRSMSAPAASFLETDPA